MNVGAQTDTPASARGQFGGLASAQSADLSCGGGLRLAANPPEQNVELALEVATRGYVLEAGIVTLKGTAAELRANPAVVAAYLGL